MPSTLAATKQNSQMSTKKINSTERQAKGFKVGVIALIGNFILFLAKIIIGIISGSIAVVADSFNSLLDSASSIITIGGFRLAAKKSDAEHPHGHGRIEYIAAFIISIIIMFTATLLASASIQKIFHPTPVDSSISAIIIMIIAIIGKAILAAFYFIENRKIHSQILRASGRDSLADLMATSVALIALWLAPVVAFPIDGIGGLLVSLFIFYLGIQSFISNFHLLVGYRPDRKTLRDIRRIVLENSSFAKVDDIHFHDYGPENREVIIKVILAPAVSAPKLERDISEVQQKLKSEYSVTAIIYWPPKRVILKSWVHSKVPS